MQLNVPPLIPLVVGALLVVLGALRAYGLGWQRRRDTDPDDERAPARRREANRHLRWGAIWVAMGLFLVISTLVNT